MRNSFADERMLVRALKSIETATPERVEAAYACARDCGINIAPVRGCWDNSKPTGSLHNFSAHATLSHAQEQQMIHDSMAEDMAVARDVADFFGVVARETPEPEKPVMVTLRDSIHTAVLNLELAMF